MTVYKTILGIDKLASYAGFAVVIISSSGILLRSEAASLETLSEIARAYKADAIAVDNIYEIGPEASIRRLITLSGADLIQVTGSPSEGFVPLSVIGKSLGVTRGEKLAPLRSAEVAALAAMKGYGFSVRVFDPETRITISKRRKFGTGGMSEGRYRRSIQGSVLNLTKKIEYSLRSRGIDYDLSLRRGSHGIEGSSFTVYAPRDRLFGVVRPIRTSSINIKITPVFTRSFRYVRMGSSEEARPKRHLIVGIDPGTTTGVAILDLSGKVLHLSSGRGLTRGQISRTVSEYGHALVIATDVTPPPALISKLAASHSAILFRPDRSLKTSEKMEMTERVAAEQGVKASDTHQRDSLAAAVKAYSFYRNKLEQAASHVASEGVTADLDSVKALVMKGMSIRDAIAQIRPHPVEPRPLKKRAGAGAGRVRVLEAKVEDLRLERDRLASEVAALKDRIEELELKARLSRIAGRPRRSKDRDLYELDRRIKSLLGEVASLKAEAEILGGENARLRSVVAGMAAGLYAVLRPSRSLTAEAVRDAASRDERVIMVNRLPGADEIPDDLRLYKISAVIVESAPPPDARAKVEGQGIPVLQTSSLKMRIEAVGGLVLIRRADLDRALDEAKEALQKTPEARVKQVRDLLEEYRRDRKMALRRG